MLELCRCPNIYGPDCIYIYTVIYTINNKEHIELKFTFFYLEMLGGEKSIIKH